jgi:hypothetical protein
MHPLFHLRWFVPRARFDQVSGAIFSLAIGLTTTAFAHSPFDNFKNYGLVGVGRIPSDTFDRYGNGHQDTLGGIFSSMDTVSGVSLLGGKILIGELLAQPDRGFGDGAFDFHPRTESLFYVMDLVSPDAQPAPGTTFPQNQIHLVNVATTLVRDQTEPADARWRSEKDRPEYTDPDLRLTFRETSS